MAALPWQAAQANTGRPVTTLRRLLISIVYTHVSWPVNDGQRHTPLVGLVRRRWRYIGYAQQRYFIIASNGENAIGLSYAISRALITRHYGATLIGRLPY